MLGALKKELYEQEEFSVLLKLVDIAKKLTYFEGGDRSSNLPSLIATEGKSLIVREKQILSYYNLKLEIENAIIRNDDNVKRFLDYQKLKENQEIFTS